MTLEIKTLRKVQSPIRGTVWDGTREQADEVIAWIAQMSGHSAIAQYTISGRSHIIRIAGPGYMTSVYPKQHLVYREGTFRAMYSELFNLQYEIEETADAGEQ